VSDLRLRMSRWLHGDPPAVEPADRFARYGFFVAWALGVAALVGDVPPLIALTGLLLVAIGTMMVSNFRGVLDRMREREERHWSYRLKGSRSVTRFGGVLMVLIGLGWGLVGFLAIFGRL
jgi:hypothetical protein